MRVGIYTDLRNPPRWRRDWRAHYARVLDRIQEAERLGAGSVWVSEHHLFEDGYLPQPLTFAAAITTRTRTARVGTAIMIAPLRPALDTAEQAAVVDILSGGRLELGLGLGYRVPEYEAYGREVSQRYAALEARVREIRRLWEDGVHAATAAGSDAYLDWGDGAAGGAACRAPRRRSCCGSARRCWTRTGPGWSKAP